MTQQQNPYAKIMKIEPNVQRAELIIIPHDTSQKSMFTTYARKAVNEFNEFPTATFQNLLRCLQFWIIERNSDEYELRSKDGWITCFHKGIKIFIIKHNQL